MTITLKRRHPEPTTAKVKQRQGSSLLSFRHALGIAILSLIAVSLPFLFRDTVAVGGNALDETPFKVMDLPGKGKGLVATRDIKQGELLIREKPLFIVPLQVSSSPSQLIWASVQKLGPHDRDEFMNLSYVNLPKGADPEKHSEEVALAIFQTNAVSAGDGSVGIFPRMARLNHGCSGSFNSVYTWRDAEGVLVVHSLKNISKGQELLTTYWNTKLPKAQRRAYLAEHYGFECDCSTCSLSDDLSQASDDRLSRMSSLYTRFSSWGTGDITGNEAADVAHEIWQLGEEEGYFSERGRLAADVVWVAASHSDYAAVQKWAQVAIRWYGIEVGNDNELVAEMITSVAEPQRHPAWGRRAKEIIRQPSDLITKLK